VRELTAFVLSGGGSLAAVQVGMLAEILAAGQRPDLIVGTSAGAINGAFFAQEPSAATVERMAQLWSRMSTREALGLSCVSLLGIAGLRGHIANPAGLRSLLTRELRCERFDQTAVPLHVICAAQVTGMQVVLSTGNLVDAVLASSAILGVFPPVDINGQTLVDGMLAADTPTATAIRFGARELVVLPCGFACAAKSVARSALGRAMHAITLLGAHQVRRDYERYSTSAAIHMVPPLCPQEQSSYDYSRDAHLLARARLDAAMDR
jgi:NTE family protein